MNRRKIKVKLGKPEINANKGESKSVLMFLSQDTFFLSHFEKYLYDKNWKITIFARKTSDKAKETIENYGYRYIDSGIDRAGTSVFREVRSLIKTIRIVKDVSPTVIHNYGLKSIIYGTMARFFACRNAKIINNLTGLGAVFIQNDWKYRIVRIVVLVLLRFLLNPRGSKVICENKDDLRRFIDNKSVRGCDACLIPGAGVDTELFKPLCWEEREEKITAVMTSRLLLSKGVLEYFEAAKILNEKGVDIQFWIIGDIDEENPNSLTRTELELLKRSRLVKVLGKRNNVQNLIKKCHICVLPSYREGLPLSLIEGASCGLAILTTDTVGCRDLIRNDNGLLCKVKDPVDLARCLAQMTKNRQLLRTMGKNSRKLALENFDEKIILKEIEDLYVKLVNSSVT